MATFYADAKAAYTDLVAQVTMTADGRITAAVGLFDSDDYTYYRTCKSFKEAFFTADRLLQKMADEMIAYLEGR
jgi:hypothetical protein